MVVEVSTIVDTKRNQCCRSDCIQGEATQPPLDSSIVTLWCQIDQKIYCQTLYMAAVSLPVRGSKVSLMEHSSEPWSWTQEHHHYHSYGGPEFFFPHWLQYFASSTPAILYPFSWFEDISSVNPCQSDTFTSSMHIPCTMGVEIELPPLLQEPSLFWEGFNHLKTEPFLTLFVYKYKSVFFGRKLPRTFKH